MGFSFRPYCWCYWWCRCRSHILLILIVEPATHIQKQFNDNNLYCWYIYDYDNCYCDWWWFDCCDWTFSNKLWCTEILRCIDTDMIFIYSELWCPDAYNVTIFLHFWRLLEILMLMLIVYDVMIFSEVMLSLFDACTSDVMIFWCRDTSNRWCILL